jgi:hypothetical protein
VSPGRVGGSGVVELAAGTPSRSQNARTFRPLAFQRASRFRQSRSRAGSGRRVATVHPPG